MTHEEKNRFCALAAALLAPPDAALVDDLRQAELHSQLSVYVQSWGGDSALLSIFPNGSGRDSFLSGLESDYASLFVDPEGARISLVESTYKTWTADKTCAMAFAAAKGLLMGDSAVHMLNLYQQSAIEIPEEFHSMPDHLVLELEFLALLYQNGSEERINQFIEDHLDWIPELKREVQKVSPHAFYGNSIELIHLFLQNELKNGKVKTYG
jgi:TorA maturation chaperone TorD